MLLGMMTQTWGKFTHEGGRSKYNMTKWKPLLDVDFKISDKCCNVMKKGPAHKYAKESGKHPITGQQASESKLRTQKWLLHGCNAFDAKEPMSNPLSFWTEQDILKYIKETGLRICSVYGEIVTADEDGNEYESSLTGDCMYRTTGCQRTGCIFCGFGAHLEKEPRFVRLKKTHPKQYDYCMGGGEYNEEGMWIPSKEGLGMAHCIDELNRIYGKDFIRY